MELFKDCPTNVDPDAFPYPELAHSINVYSSNYIIRQYIDWPDTLPLPISLPHSYSSHPQVNDMLANPFSHFWAYGDCDYDYFIRSGLIGYKYIWKCGAIALYNDIVGISEEQRRGTISMFLFPCGQQQLPLDFFEKYCEQLSNLPDKFHPITVSLHRRMKDFVPTCTKYNLQHVCFGHHQHLFTKSVCEALSKFKYVTSDYWGAPQWYSIWRGCKFFYLGKSMVTRPDGVLINRRKYKEKLFSIDNVEKDINHKRTLMEWHLGVTYKKSKSELQRLIEFWAKDTKYQYLLYLRNKFFSDARRPMSEFIKDWQRHDYKEWDNLLLDRG